MKDIPVEARVIYADGAEAESRGVIVEGGTRKVTHYVVEDKHLARPPYERLVPADQVQESTRDLIRLGCTQEDVGQMPPFATTRYVLEGSHDYTLYEGGENPAASASTVGAPGKEQEEELIPEGELAIDRGTRVEATDGYIGQVAELLVEEDTEVVSQVILDEGHLFGHRDVALPLLAIDRAEGDTTYLKLDKPSSGCRNTLADVALAEDTNAQPPPKWWPKSLTIRTGPSRRWSLSRTCTARKL